MIVIRQLSDDLIKQITNNSKILLALVILFASLTRNLCSIQKSAKSYT